MESDVEIELVPEPTLPDNPFLFWHTGYVESAELPVIEW